ncbi:MAG: 2-succinyl-5-enolpyruvyl-6-hydroxy-3-cyclohexene-1-carboxylic-acid synthase [Acidimicrobiales bacterium]
MSKLAASTQATFCATLVDEWARGGVRHAVVAPGSRSTPMVLALAADERIEVHVRIDERSAGFTALGIGLASGVPAILLTTSGTAAAEVHAAVVEAHQALVPMLVCTGDRPPELHGVGAPQTIVQSGLYGSAVRFFVDAGVPDEQQHPTWRSLAARLFCEATGSPGGPGPVHLNLAFREPFEAVAGTLPTGRPEGACWHAVVPWAPSSTPGPLHPTPLDRVVESARRPVLVVGARGGTPDLVLGTAARLGWPVLADPRSGCRLSGEAAHGATVVTAADALVRGPRFAEAHEPDLVVRLGEAWASKAVAGWLTDTTRSGAFHVLVDPHGEWRDPAHEASFVVRAQPDEVLDLMAALPGSVDAAWAGSWRLAEQRAQGAFESTLASLAGNGELTEPQIARSLVARLGTGTLVVSSSMPIRDVEWFSPASTGYPRVLANRGANGIDGVASTTMGVAIGGAVGPVVGLLGDLAFLHDLTALLRPGSAAARSRPAEAWGLVVVDNGGGGIFSYLPQAETVPPDRFEQLFATPQATDVAELARAAGCLVTEVDKSADLDRGIEEFLGRIRPTGSLAPGAPPVLLCRTDRASQVGAHSELNEAVARAVGSI